MRTLLSPFPHGNYFSKKKFLLIAFLHKLFSFRRYIYENTFNKFSIVTKNGRGRSAMTVFCGHKASRRKFEETSSRCTFFLISSWLPAISSLDITAFVNHPQDTNFFNRRAIFVIESASTAQRVNFIDGQRSPGGLNWFSFGFHSFPAVYQYLCSVKAICVISTRSLNKRLEWSLNKVWMNPENCKNRNYTFRARG